MRSSASTPSRSPSHRIRLLVLVAGEDHPKACTGRRLIRWGRATDANRAAHGPGVVLDPFASVPLSGADRGAALRGGLLAVDCSWNRLSDRGALPQGAVDRVAAGIRRRLPILVATNPQHYGRLAQLNTVEALAAGAYILGSPPEARTLLEGFHGGAEFLSINAERLDRYRSAADPEATLRAERALFGGG